MKILIIPGSLRSTSSSHHIIRAVSGFFPRDFELEISDAPGTLPHFNDVESPSNSVILFRQQLREADGVIIVTPEYAFGIPGSLKNAIDWTVGSGEFVGKPVAVITASSQGQYGHAALLLVLQAVSAQVIDESCMVISAIRSRLDEHGHVKDESTKGAIRNSIDLFVKKITSIHDK